MSKSKHVIELFSLLTVKRRLKRKSVYLMHLMLVSMAPGVRRH